MQKVLTIALSIVYISLLTNCGGGSSQSEEAGSSSEIPGKATETTVTEASNENFMENKGVGPVTSVTLGELNQELADQGKQLYNTMCIACHKIEEKFIGPAPKGILSRRSPEWIMNMILNPDGMIKEDPIAIKLLAEYNNAPMANQNLTEDQARSILEFFRTLED
ncbi:MAG: cytochrome c [Cyclobacteriaceae bacterium]|nr:cytochrome c [Cyclobacteriaceae bacterium]